jgi:hypothetical protein
MSETELKVSGPRATYRRIRKRLGFACGSEMVALESASGEAEIELCETCLEHRIRLATVEIARGDDGATLVSSLYRSAEIARSKGFDQDAEDFEAVARGFEEY